MSFDLIEFCVLIDTCMGGAGRLNVYSIISLFVSHSVSLVISHLIQSLSLNLVEALHTLLAG